MINQNIRDKVRKLLDMAEMGTEHEAKVAMEKVHELMKAYGITQADARIFTVEMTAPIRKEKWLITLFNICGQFSGVLPLFTRKKFCYAGDEVGVTVSQEFFHYLKDELKRKLKASKLKARKSRNDFRLGFVMGVLGKLEKVGGWRDMNEKVQKLKKEYFPDVETYYNKKAITVNQHFYEAGKTVGANTNINRQAGVNINAGYLEGVH